MGKMTLRLESGREAEFDISESGQGAPCFLLSIRKCGSSLANNICKAMANRNRRCFVEVGDTFFRNNLPIKQWQMDPALRDLIRPGVIYGGFRDAPIGLHRDPRFYKSPKILFVRDLRDALVSEYFSNAFSHPVPDVTGEYNDVAAEVLELRETALRDNVETYVLQNAKFLNHTAHHYKALMNMPNLRVVRYEDVIFNKRALIQAYAEHFNMEATEGDIEGILKWADVLPKQEDPRAFIRRVTPGDHKEKLSPAAIAQINVIMHDSLELLGYR